MDQSEYYASISSLKPHQLNYKHGDIGAIITSILKFGFKGALRVWRDNTVIAGNHTLLALMAIKAQGLAAPKGVKVVDSEWHVLCLDCTDLNPTEAKAFMVADNRTAELGSNDNETLASILTEIAEIDPTLLSATGYDGDDLDAMLAEANLSVEDILKRENKKIQAEKEEDDEDVSPNRRRDQAESNEVKTVSVFFLDTETYKRFMENATTIASNRGLENVNQAVILAVELAAKLKH